MKHGFWLGFQYGVRHPITNARMCVTRLLICLAMKTCVMGECYDRLEDALWREFPLI